MGRECKTVVFIAEIVGVGSERVPKEGRHLTARSVQAQRKFANFDLGSAFSRYKSRSFSRQLDNARREAGAGVGGVVCFLFTSVRTCGEYTCVVYIPKDVRLLLLVVPAVGHAGRGGFLTGFCLFA